MADKSFFCLVLVCASLAVVGAKSISENQQTLSSPESWRDVRRGMIGEIWDIFGNFISKAEDVWCDATLGCLNITEEWYSSMRPINVLPDERSKINTRFYLHTRENRAMDIDLSIVAHDATILEASTFDPSKPIKFIIHGFIDTGKTYWLPILADNLLNYGDYNVFRVDWGDGSLPMYSQAAANTRVVGLEIGYLVNWLISDYGVKAADIHLMGHSLGSHISGYAGEQINGLGRITGLDPAGPYYTNTATFIRLDPSDAIFVDNIHTDADSILVLGYGTGQPMGNVDFYPNSGHDQPGCDPVSIAIDAITPEDVGDIRDIAVCSHCRAIFLFQDSLLSESCNFLAHECYDYETFQSGDCGSCGSDNSRCAYMGIRADEYVKKDRTNAMMYFDTDDEEPFCYEHYEVSILTGHPDEAEDWVVGKLTATLYGDDGQILSDVQISDEHMRIDHGTVNRFQFTNHMNLGYIMRAELKWEYDDQFLRPGTYCWSLVCNRHLYVESVLISPINYYPESERLAHTQTFCQSSGDVLEIKDGKTQSIAPYGLCTPVQ